jgi:hypothetical protein
MNHIMEDIIPKEYQKHFNNKQAGSESGVMVIIKIMASATPKNLKQSL